jgi:glucose-1-phosphate adenylyltransferase
MDLLGEQPALDLYDPEWPIWTLPEQLPPAKVLDTARHRSVIADSMLSAGTVIHGAAITRSVLAPKVRVGENAELDESIVLPGAHIGAGCKLRRVIVESGLAIPDGTAVNAGARGRDGITLLTQNSIATAVRSDWTLARAAS